jgi:hypothetical protein
MGAVRSVDRGIAQRQHRCEWDCGLHRLHRPPHYGAGNDPVVSTEHLTNLACSDTNLEGILRATWVCLDQHL